MRRYLLVFLMLLLPLQSVWSAAATICAHEQTQAGERHFGHHEAHHATNGATDDANASGASDADHHHVLNVHPVSHAAPLALPMAQATRHIPAVSDPYPSAHIASLERPPKTSADLPRQGLRARA
ncbi:MAG: czcI [Variovorax sp.]|nr:czcI [Variovorax sp.]